MAMHLRAIVQACLPDFPEIVPFVQYAGFTDEQRVTKVNQILVEHELTLPEHRGCSGPVKTSIETSKFS